LKEQGDILLAQFEQMYKELLKESDEYNSRVLERESLLDTVIAQIEEKRDQPAVEFLMDVGKILSSCEAAKAPIPEPVSPELQRSIKSLSEMRQVVLDMVAKFKVKLQSQTDSEREQVTLDPETASPHLTLSQDLKTIRLGGGKQKQKNPNLPDTSKRFTGSPSVLGSQG
ncbi:TRI15 protein, partial [Erpornis zantholeuca]|nr:TRI15 protein [Erpornis zantholeuca]